MSLSFGDAFNQSLEQVTCPKILDCLGIHVDLLECLKINKNCKKQQKLLAELQAP